MDARKRERGVRAGGGGEERDREGSGGVRGVGK